MADAIEAERVADLKGKMKALKAEADSAGTRYLEAFEEIRAAFEKAVLAIDEATNAHHEASRQYRKHAASIGASGDLEGLKHGNLGPYGQMLGFAIGAARSEAKRNEKRLQVATA